MPKSLKIILICLCLAAIIFCVVIGISYIPRHVQQEFSGIELRITSEDEYEILQTLYIRIDGRVRYGIFASFPLFDGSIEVSAYDFTLDNPHLGISFFNGFSLGGAMSYPVLVRDASRSPATRIESLGWIYTNEDFSSLVIHIAEWTSMGGGSYQGQPGNRVIVAPATNIIAALELLHSYGFVWVYEFGLVNQALINRLELLIE